MIECGECTDTAAIPGCRLLSPGGKVEVVVSVCIDCPETGRRPSEALVRPALPPEDERGVRRHCLSSLAYERW